jgi:hypothetical protein
LDSTRAEDYEVALLGFLVNGKERNIKVGSTTTFGDLADDVGLDRKSLKDSDENQLSQSLRVMKAVDESSHEISFARLDMHCDNPRAIVPMGPGRYELHGKPTVRGK